MIRKTMRIGEVRTSIKLEGEFWAYLKEIADERRIRVSALVNEVANASPERTNLASTLRTYSLDHARTRGRTLRRDLDELALAGSSHDLVRVLDASPLPALMLDEERTIRTINRAFGQWLNVDTKATAGQRLENIMILRGQGLREMWACLKDGRLTRAGFNATYVSPGKVRTSQALAIGIGGDREGGNGARRGFVVIFETLAARS
jgi:predicted DNA-binding ribbon-helix-helix protein